MGIAVELFLRACYKIIVWTRVCRWNRILVFFLRKFEFFVLVETVKNPRLH
jgi:hypothetical protein